MSFPVLSCSQENSSESITSSSRGESGRSRQNGSSSRHSPQEGSSESLNSRKEKGALVSEKKVQVMSQASKMSKPHKTLIIPSLVDKNYQSKLLNFFFYCRSFVHLNPGQTRDCKQTFFLVCLFSFFCLPPSIPVCLSHVPSLPSSAEG